ncbi:MAG: tRNA (adenosine(37)-N6)-threonylcarbamoyltransferase complex dimerization subunit type 1 TsaB [Planctomycetota bacterium]|nr:MAG: tRNA (adenosine(37)-N6)-threonylcarbamoyltransferase complex dimerization subunit type 1 TsaB [Planctomycetota bacterium]
MKQGPLLALELSGPRSSIALALPGAAIVERGFGGERGRRLLAEVAALAEETGTKPVDLAGVLVGVGPGSYTGLRIACAAARTLAAALGIPVGGLCSFAAAALAAPLGAEVDLLLDAYRGEVYHARYRRDEEPIEVVAPRVLARTEAAAAIAGDRLIGDPALLGGNAGGVAVVAPEVAPTARQLLLLGGSRPDRWLPPEPLYLRAAR